MWAPRRRMTKIGSMSRTRTAESRDGCHAQPSLIMMTRPTAVAAQHRLMSRRRLLPRTLSLKTVLTKFLLIQLNQQRRLSRKLFQRRLSRKLFQRRLSQKLSPKCYRSQPSLKVQTNVPARRQRQPNRQSKGPEGHGERQNRLQQRQQPWQVSWNLRSQTRSDHHRQRGHAHHQHGRAQRLKLLLLPLSLQLMHHVQLKRRQRMRSQRRRSPRRMSWQCLLLQRLSAAAPASHLLSMRLL
mmetsp:Transcript_47595/g.86000  ORF Transcript_47595/g.86000 Transcript_47595/m.86000 type:complete len:240 (+) Transcript_47595:1102-1821(+)